MILEVFERSNQRCAGKIIKTAHVQCDTCKDEFQRDLSRVTSDRHYCSNSCKQTGKSPSPEQRNAIKRKLTGIKRSVETRRKMSENNSTKCVSVRKKISQTRAAGIANGSICPFYKGHHGTYRSTKTNRDEYYHSHLERDRMRSFDADDEVSFWTKKHEIVLNYTFNDKQSSYVPDFLFETSVGVFIEEVKGWEGEPRLHAKLLALREYCHDRGFNVSYMNTKSVKQELDRFGIERT